MKTRVAAGAVMVAFLVGVMGQAGAVDTGRLLGLWTNLKHTPRGTLPGNSQMAYDGVHGVVLAPLVLSTSTGPQDAIGAFDGASWHTYPASPGQGGQFVTDEVTGQAFQIDLYGGCAGVWMGTGWSPGVCPPPPPTGSFFQTQVAAYDPVDRAVIAVFDRRVVPICESCNPTVIDTETWLWNGAVWTRRLPAHEPSAVLASNDDANKTVIALAGLMMWIWNGVDWSATPLQPGLSSLTYDPQTGTVAGYDGTPGLGIWRWGGKNWTPEVTLGLPPQTGDIVYFPKLSSIILLGPMETVRHPSPTFAAPDSTWRLVPLR